MEGSDEVGKTPPPPSGSMEKITIPLPGMEDGLIYFPKEMSFEQQRLAVKMANFILTNFYNIPDHSGGGS